MMPRISLIVPVYDVADHVGACLASIAAQTFADFEVIVVDDGSTDGSGAIAQAAVATDPRFIFLEQDNAGLSAARNAGLTRARGDLVGFVDSDDRIAPTYLERLVEALEQHGADWVSCGIAFQAGEGKPRYHSGLHDADEIVAETGPVRYDLTDWTQVIRHFPSVWNKLYRRELIKGLRFDEGLNYEDHAFYWRCAARTDHILHLPEALYLSTQGRAGQITRDGSDRVFEQFAVLDILEGILSHVERPGGPAALARIATRLTFERANVIGDRARRTRFLHHAQAWMDARGLRSDGALSVPAFWPEALQGQVPLSVVVPTNGDEEALRETLDSLSAQSLREMEVLVVPDEAVCGPGSGPRRIVHRLAADRPAVSVIAGGAGVAGARNRGLQVAQGVAVVFLDAGDTLMPRALMAWHNRLRQAGAGLGLARFRMGDAETVHSGLHDTAAMPTERREDPTGFEPNPADGLVLHGHPSAKIFDRALLQRVGDFPEGALSTTHLLLRALAEVQRVVFLPAFPVRIAIRPATRTQWRMPVRAGDLRAALEAIALDPRLNLSPGGLARLWARLVWEKVNHADWPEAEAALFEAEVRTLSRSVPGLGPDTPLDPFIGPRVRELLGLAG